MKRTHGKRDYKKSSGASSGGASGAAVGPKGRSKQRIGSSATDRTRPSQSRRHPGRSAATPAQADRPSLRDKARWVVGIHSCCETLRVRPKTVREVWLREDWASSQQLRELQELAERGKVVIREKAVGQLDTIGGGHQGVALAVTQNPEVSWELLKEQESGIVLILDGIEDPHNLGSILRTSWLTAVSAIFIPADRAVGLTPAVCKVASGGAEHVAVEAEPNLQTVMERLKECGYWIYGLAEAGTRPPWGFVLAKKVAWVIGSEGSGIRKATERACDELVRIPQVATGSSFNASIACAMALSETCRQHGRPE